MPPRMPVAIDPMALILSEKEYVRWVEGKHPHVPKAAEIETFFETMPPEERRASISRAQDLVACGKAVQEVATRMR